MAPRPPQDVEALQQRLERLGAALGQAPLSAPERPEGASGALKASRAAMALAVALVAVAIATRTGPMLALAALLALVAGVLRLGGAGARLSSSPASRDPSRPHVGMGAEVASDAVIEPGATVEMGASVGAGAVVKRGAVVRMGASVHARAVIEPGAVVGWGVDVHEGARVGRDATVGAGASVQAGASVPAGMRLMPGSTWSKGAGAAAPSPAVEDPREVRIRAACERLEAELRQAPESVREYLGASGETVQALRDTCLGLLERERVLRHECSPEGLAFLAQERAALEGRMASAADPAVRRSLEQALAALDEQRRQRGLLQQSAERLDAELTRLMWTLDGMGTQLVRLRTAGAAASAPDAAVLQSMQQLHAEIDAIAEALEHVARADTMEPIAELGPQTPSTSVRPRERS